MDTGNKLGITVGIILGVVTIAVGLSHFQKQDDKPDESSSKYTELIATGRECSVSAPGKALIAGGYLVLEKENIAVTVAASSRFYSTVTMLLDPAAKRRDNCIEIFVDSPQFHTTYSFLYDYAANSLTPNSENRNEFVEKCFSIVLSFVLEHYGHESFSKLMNRLRTQGKLAIKLRADNDFYSHIAELQSAKQELLSANLRRLPRFLPCQKDSSGKPIVSKTGMGSSAALTTALVASLLQYFGLIRLNCRVADDDRRIVHNLSQLAHAIAQGKLGSGFDVSAAVYGTQIYQRFDADKLQHCMEDTSSTSASVLYNAVIDAKNWTQRLTSFSLPPMIDIIMGDVCGGSSSTSMAKDVLKWKKENPVVASELWESLARTNKDIYASLQELRRLSIVFPVEYVAAMEAAANSVIVQLNPEQVSQGRERELAILTELVTLSRHINTSRNYLRTIGEQARVGIEPPSQTALVDHTLSVAGVIGAGVPGAGGVDAIYALIIVSSSQQGSSTNSSSSSSCCISSIDCKVRLAVESAWSQWGNSSNNSSNSSSVVCPLMLTADTGLFTGVRAEFDLKW